MNTQAQHTPGPWRVKPSIGGFPSVVAENYEVATPSFAGETLGTLRVNAAKGGEIMANARLIAAAPELLEALRVASLVCAKQNSLSYSDRREAHEIVMAAIAKAEGKL